MLLRRITQHVRDQNWFAVFLDFLIVVVGILIAFQINAWSDRQADKRALHVALERLYEEIQTNIATIDKYSKRHTDIMTAGQTLLKRVRDPKLNSVPIELIAKVFVNGFTTDYSTSALTAVLGQQTFQGLQSNELRPLISSLPAEYLDAMEDEQTVIQLVDTHWVAYISQHLPVGPLWASSYKGTEWESYFMSAKAADDFDAVSVPEFKKLATTLIFQNEIINRAEYERLILIEQQELRDVLEKALALIEAEVK
ncbi:MAG: hypothetical protein HKN88_05835 [Gammaproteobacteria bacterium]|nr:hypothetical protein [Gammaproteobacteria bacterium]NNC97576.1 hypothetical protein [Gammaproteobacteria bacterium]NNM12938.1 hypothetical protein [Gammaproteobacteria bacterium]